jgi:hypothetical protein
MSLNNNKPVFHCEETNEIPFSTTIARGICLMLVLVSYYTGNNKWSVRKAEFFFATYTTPVVSQHVFKQQ